MIVRLTVNDNDYIDALGTFCRRIKKGQVILEQPPAVVNM